MIRILLGIAFFFLLDGALFRSGLYATIMTSESMQGAAHHFVSALEALPPNPEKDILVVGDSRSAEGFNAGLATRLFGEDGTRFLPAGMPGVGARDWCYILERLDPKADRYRVIALTLRSFRKSPPQGAGFDDRVIDGDILGPLISTPAFIDLIGHQPGFDHKLDLWSRVIVSALNYRADFNDLVLHPIRRLGNYHWRRVIGIHFSDGYNGRPETMTGLAWDPQTRTLRYPERLTEAQRREIDADIEHPYWDGVEQEDAYNDYWIMRILRRYQGTSTQVVLVRLPNFPLHGILDEKALPFSTLVHDAESLGNATILPEDTLLDLERPEFFFDNRHLNMEGRARLTETLAPLLKDISLRAPPKLAGRAAAAPIHVNQ